MEYKKLSELQQASNPNRCEVYGIENGKSVRVPLNFTERNIFEQFVQNIEEFAESTNEIHEFLGIGIRNIENAVFNQVKWSESFNLNDYKKQGIYYITGERLLSEYDNLPIMNASSGHTISGQLTVLDASLSDAEMCVTQYLKLTNRTGSEGKEYIRTYNKYSNGSEDWSAWRELKQTANLNQISDAELKNYTENGLYEGAIFNGSYDIQDINTTIASFISASKSPDGARELPSGTLFTMEVLNNYAVVQKAEQMGLPVPSIIVQRAKILLIGGSYSEVNRVYFNVDDNGPRSYWSGWRIINI